MRIFLYKIKLKYLNWKYREVPDDVCCCGGDMIHSFWENHSPKSMRAWAIECDLKGNSI